MRKKKLATGKLRRLEEKGKKRKERERERERMKRYACNRKKKFECQVHAAKRSCLTRAAILCERRSAGTGKLAGADSGLDDDGCIPKDVASNG